MPSCNPLSQSLHIWSGKESLSHLAATAVQEGNLPSFQMQRISKGTGCASPMTSLSLWKRAGLFPQPSSYSSTHMFSSQGREILRRPHTCEIIWTVFILSCMLHSLCSASGDATTCIWILDFWYFPDGEAPLSEEHAWETPGSLYL